MTSCLSLSGPQWARPVSMFYSVVCQSRVSYQRESLSSLLRVYVSTLGADSGEVKRLVPVLTQESIGNNSNIRVKTIAYPYPLQFIPQHVLDELMFSFWDNTIRLQVICRVLGWTYFRPKS